MDCVEQDPAHFGQQAMNQLTVKNTFVHVAANETEDCGGGLRARASSDCFLPGRLRDDKDGCDFEGCGKVEFVLRDLDGFDDDDVATDEEKAPQPLRCYQHLSLDDLDDAEYGDVPNRGRSDPISWGNFREGSPGSDMCHSPGRTSSPLPLGIRTPDYWDRSASPERLPEADTAAVRKSPAPLLRSRVNSRSSAAAFAALREDAGVTSAASSSARATTAIDDGEEADSETDARARALRTARQHIAREHQRLAQERERLASENQKLVQQYLTVSSAASVPQAAAPAPAVPAPSAGSASAPFAAATCQGREEPESSAASLPSAQQLVCLALPIPAEQQRALERLAQQPPLIPQQFFMQSQLPLQMQQQQQLQQQQPQMKMSRRARKNFNAATLAQQPASQHLHVPQQLQIGQHFQVMQQQKQNSLQHKSSDDGRQRRQPVNARAEASDIGGAAALSSSAFGAAEESVPLVPEEERTTLMIRNVPNSYDRATLLSTMHREGFAGLYDFVYLPIDFSSGQSLGYAFLNFVSNAAARKFWEKFHHFVRWEVVSKKCCVVGWSDPYQGLESNVERYRNSPVMHSIVPEEYKPQIYQNGVPRPFPEPTRKLRAPRIRGQGKDCLNTFQAAKR
eukprot:TRINITY_DN2414_c4_g1_i1.p1 TRINITY_DN2414_c4_g1~~TRINITY_DN2414_c4_g1_i1.p1  ORF type:complete len:625 (-),score=134.82 TRINITY_DN2414_c4_g1_i1:132-2006(-)